MCAGIWSPTFLLVALPYASCAQSADKLAKQTQNPARTDRIIWECRSRGAPCQTTTNALGNEQVGLGPSLVALAQPGNFVIGAGSALASPAGTDWKLRLQANFLFPADRHFSTQPRQLPMPNFQLPKHSQSTGRKFFGSSELEVGNWTPEPAIFAR